MGGEGQRGSSTSSGQEGVKGGGSENAPAPVVSTEALEFYEAELKRMEQALDSVNEVSDSEASTQPAVPQDWLWLVHLEMKLYCRRQASLFIVP